MRKTKSKNCRIRSIESRLESVSSLPNSKIVDKLLHIKDVSNQQWQTVYISEVDLSKRNTEIKSNMASLKNTFGKF